MTKINQETKTPCLHLKTQKFEFMNYLFYIYLFSFFLFFFFFKRFSLFLINVKLITHI